MFVDFLPVGLGNWAEISLDFVLVVFYVAHMHSFHSILTLVQGAIAVASKRDTSMPMFFIALWNRVGRMGRRLEKLIALWRAGKLPKARVRPPQTGKNPDRVRQPHVSFPSGHGWLRPRAPEVAAYVGMLEMLLDREEIARFVDEVPQARRIVAVLKRMLIVPPGKIVAKLKRQEVWPPAAWVEGVKQSGMHVMPTGRLEWN